MNHRNDANHGGHVDDAGAPYKGRSTVTAVGLPMPHLHLRPLQVRLLAVLPMFLTVAGRIVFHLL